MKTATRMPDAATGAETPKTSTGAQNGICTSRVVVGQERAYELETVLLLRVSLLLTLSAVA